MRRAVAAGVIVVVLILMVIGIHSCQVSARNSALKDYNNSVASLNQQSAQDGKNFFVVLSTGATGNTTSLQDQINLARKTADSELGRARGIDVPDEVKTAQRNFLLALQMRRDGIASIAQKLGRALGSATKRDAVSQIAAEMALFYASDVLYKRYTVPLIVSALHSAGIAVGGQTGEQLNSDQFLADIRWLTPAYVASQLHVTLPTPSGKIAPGLHGHALSSVSVAGTTLQTGSTNTITATPAPTFTLMFANTGQNTETNVVCKIAVSSSSVSGQTTVAQTTAGQQTSCQVPLSASPSPGNYTVTATIQPVPGEKNTANNTLSFPVTFR